MAETLPVADMLPNKFEPKRQFRWVFAIEGIDAFLMKAAARPSVSIGEQTLEFINSKRYLAGKFEWNTMTLGLHDPIAPSAAQKTMEWARLAHETISGRDGYAAFYKKNFNLIALDPVGAAVEKWEIRGAFITDATFGDYDMTSGEVMNIDLTIRMDECILRY